MEKAAQRYPDLFTARVVGFGDCVVFVNHPQALQKILTNDRKQFTAPGELNKMLKPLTGDYAVFMLEGDRHKRERQYSLYEFMPFGGGVRRCLGEALAQFEMKLVLATILSRYQLAPRKIPDKTGQPYTRSRV